MCLFYYAVLCFAMQSFVSFLILQLVADFNCLPDVMRLILPLSHGAVGWSAVCDCGISWSYSRISMVIFIFCF